MLTEVMEHFGLERELHTAGFYETEHHRQVIKDIRATVGGGRLIAVTGIDLLEDCRLLLRHLEQGGPFPVSLAYDRSRAAAEVRQRDHGRALWSAGSARLAVVLTCAFWSGSGWVDGAVAAEMTAVACCFFARARLGRDGQRRTAPQVPSGAVQDAPTRPEPAGGPRQTLRAVAQTVLSAWDDAAEGRPNLPAAIDAVRSALDKTPSARTAPGLSRPPAPTPSAPPF